MYGFVSLLIKQKKNLSAFEDYGLSSADPTLLNIVSKLLTTYFYIFS